MRFVVASACLVLAACTPLPAKAPVRTVVILGNKTEASACTCPEIAHEQARAESWKAYAEKLEVRLGIPHRGEQQP